MAAKMARARLLERWWGVTRRCLGRGPSLVTNAAGVSNGSDSGLSIVPVRDSDDLYLRGTRGCSRSCRPSMAAPTNVSTPIQELSRLLAAIESPGSFATVHTARADHLRIDVKGVGRLRLPLTATQALTLCSVARPARHGFKDETRLDRHVRDTWEIPRSRIAIDRRAWSATLDPVLDVVRRDLGLPDRCRLRAELHDMLVYEPGQFFVPHQDSEKGDGMIGTLAVILPSAFSGGQMVIEHHGQRVVAGGSRSRLTFVAFYADCHHEVRPVTRGYRCVLTYNLLLAGDTRTTPAAFRQIDRLTERIRRHFETPPPPRWARDVDREPPDRLVYLLDHQYTQRSLGWDRLKNGDAARTAALREAARRLDCDISLALADVHETWSCEDEWEAFGYGRRSGRRRTWHDEGRDERGEPPLTELMDSSVELRHFVGLDARVRPGAIALAIGEHEWCCTKPSSDLDPFQSEHEGYMGNWGNTVDRWYHRAAVVIWPRERTFVIRARASARWALGEIAAALRAGDQAGARQLTERVRPFWTTVARREDGRGFFPRTLAVAAGLDAPDLASALLQPFSMTALTPDDTPRLVALLERYGVAWCKAVIGHWASAVLEGRGSPAAWLTAALPDVCRALCAAPEHGGVDLAGWLTREQWEWFTRQRAELRDHPYPKEVAGEVAALGPVLLSLIESAVATAGTDLHRELVGETRNFLASELIGLLRAAHGRHPRRGLAHLGLAAVHARCLADVTAKLAEPPRASDDWSMVDDVRCRCERCATLAAFLRARDRRRLEWPLARNDRAHVHTTIDGHGLPVTHATRRVGRPFTLVLEKTPAVFAREAAARQRLQRDVAWLTRTAPAFGYKSG